MYLKKNFYVLSLFFLFSCGTNKDLVALKQITKEHKRIAVLPPDIYYTTKGKLNPVQMEKLTKDDSKVLQEQMTHWLTNKLSKKPNIKIQDVNTTNSLLISKDFSDSKSLKEIAKILNVDGVITSNFTLAQPFTLVEALIVEEIIGLPSATSKANGIVNLYDVNSDSLIWSYSSKKDNSWGVVKARTPNDLVNSIMKKASINMPY
jgi:hypothetical protein